MKAKQLQIFALIVGVLVTLSTGAVVKRAPPTEDGDMEVATENAEKKPLELRKGDFSDDFDSDGDPVKTNKSLEFPGKSEIEKNHLQDKEDEVNFGNFYDHISPERTEDTDAVDEMGELTEEIRQDIDDILELIAARQPLDYDVNKVSDLEKQLPPDYSKSNNRETHKDGKEILTKDKIYKHTNQDGDVIMVVDEDKLIKGDHEEPLHVHETIKTLHNEEMMSDNKP